MSPRGWTAMAALGWVCLSAAALGARPGAAPAAPAVAGEIKVTTPKEGQEISFSEGSMFAIGTVPSEDYAMRCNGKIVDVWSEGAFIGYVPLKKVAFTLPDQRQADIALEFEAFKGKEKLTKVVHLVSPASPSHSKPQAESYNPAQVVESQQDHWIGMENEDASKDKVVLNLGKVIYMPAGARVAVGEKKTVLQEQKLLTQVRFTELIEDGTIWANAAFFKPSDGKPT
ncbi:MAG: hypothetical protein JO317_09505, partial [Verrucomicrobiae bacterium]|nr:hypothetical protein [Verrucomicrobiae bacterium]